MLYYLFATLYVLVCFLLLVVVLLQQGKGGDIAGAFGGASSQTAFGARAGATVLTRATAVLAALFMVGSFLLGVMGKRGGGGSVVGGIAAPADAKPAAPALPAGRACAAAAPPPTPTPAPRAIRAARRRRPPRRADAGKSTPPAAPGGKKGGGK